MEDIRLINPIKIDHVGIAVKDIVRSLDFYQTALGLSLVDIRVLEDMALKVAFLAVGESRFELIEPLGKDNTVSRFLSSRGEGVHHIALLVKDIKKTVLQLKSYNIRVVNEEPIEGADGKYILFLNPKDTNGVLIELCQYKDKR